MDSATSSSLAAQVDKAIRQVEHPEIAMPLVDLGMVRDIATGDEGTKLTLVVPFMGIPDAVRDYMVGSLDQAVTTAGGKLASVQLAVMTEDERAAFFAKEQAHWRG